MSLHRRVAGSSMKYNDLVFAGEGMADMSGERGRQAEKPATWRTLMEPHFLTAGEISIPPRSAPP